MMKSLRKDTGGYALLYVMVIVFVLCAISMMICTVALRNLQSQEASVKRMEEKYTAQGEIEKIKAQFDTKVLTIDLGTDGREATAKEAFVNKMCEDASVYQAVGGTQLKVIASKENTQITAILNVDDVTITSHEVVINANTGQKETHYTLTGVSTSFTSYTIESTGGVA